jgi:hypothetical protein
MCPAINIHAGVFPVHGLILAHFSFIEKGKILLNQAGFFAVWVFCGITAKRRFGYDMPFHYSAEPGSRTENLT